MAEKKTTTKKVSSIHDKLIAMQQEVAKQRLLKEGIGSYSNNFFSEEQTFKLWNTHNIHNLLLSFDVLVDSIQFINAEKGTGVVGILEWKLSDGKESITGKTPFGNVNPSGNYSFAIESAKTYARRNIIGELLLLTVTGDSDPESPGNVKDQIKVGMTSAIGTIFEGEPTIIGKEQAPIQVQAPVQEVQPKMDTLDESFYIFLTSDAFKELLQNNEEFRKLLQSFSEKYGEQVGTFPEDVKKEILAWKK